MTRKIKKVGNFSPTGHYGKNVYDSNGLCPTLCSGSVVKNGLNIITTGGGNSHMDEKIIDENFTKISEDKYVTTERERECLCDYDTPTHYGFE